MARVPDYPPTPLPTPPGSQRAVQCPECGIVLNIPPAALGRRLKCPRCETRFPAPDAEGTSSATIPTMTGSSAASSMYAPRAADLGGSAASSLYGPNVVGAGGGSNSELELPSSLPTLRDSFDLPLLSDLASTPAAAPPPSDGAADAMSLFQDEPKAARRPKAGAEARAQARRCPTCSGVVPVGMSLCSRCGLDLDTGQRIEQDDLFDEAPAAPRSTSFPMGVAIIGGIAAMASVLLMVVTAIAWQRGLEGGQFLLAICVFGIYASVQFLRRKSARLLLVALSLGLMVDVLGLIALPIYNANFGDNVVVAAPFDPQPAGGEAEELEGPRLQSLEEKLDMQKITWGVILMLGYAGIAVYLHTPSFRRQFARG